MKHQRSNIGTQLSLFPDLLVDYLDALIDRLEATPWQVDGTFLKTTDVGIEQRVITKTPRRRDRDEVDRFTASFEPASRFYEIESDAGKFETLSWSAAVRQNPRLVVKGAPGSGKTFSSRLFSIDAAKRSIERIINFEAEFQDIEIPFWITSKELAQSKKTKVADAIVDIVRRQFESLELDDIFYRWLITHLRAVLHPDGSQSLRKHPLFIVIDALDELTQAELKNFERLANQLDRSGVNLLATCRTLQFDARSHLLGWRDLKELELAPLMKYQKVEFLDKFFSVDRDLRDSARDLLAGNYAVDYASDISLILTFICFLHIKRMIKQDSSYIDIYKLMLYDLFRGSWKKEKPFWVDDGSAARWTQRLESIAFYIFSGNAESNHFSLHNWDDAATAAEVPNEYRDRFRDELEQIGFIVSAGVDDKGDECWSFPHRTLLEFGAAKALNRRDDWFEICRSRYCDVTWWEVLAFVAGLGDSIKKASLMINDLEYETRDGYLKDEVFGIASFLQCKLIGMSSSDEPLASTVSDRVIRAIGSALRLHNLVPTLLNSSRGCNFSSLFLDDSLALLALNSKSRKSIDHFVKELLDSIEDDLFSDSFEQFRAIRFVAGIRGIDKRRLCGLLLTILEDVNFDEIWLADVANAFRIGGLRLPAVKDALSTLVNHGEFDVTGRSEIAAAILDLWGANDPIVMRIEQFYKSFNQDFWELRPLTEALRKIGRTESVAAHLKSNFDKSQTLRFRLDICDSLVDLGQPDENVADLCNDIIEHPNQHFSGEQTLGDYIDVFSSAINILGRINWESRRINLNLIDALSGHDNIITIEAVYALGRRGIDPEITLALTSLFRSESDLYVRLAIAMVLVRQQDSIDNQTIDFLLEHYSKARIVQRMEIAEVLSLAVTERRIRNLEIYRPKIAKLLIRGLSKWETIFDAAGDKDDTRFFFTEQRFGRSLFNLWHSSDRNEQTALLTWEMQNLTDSDFNEAIN